MKVTKKQQVKKALLRGEILNVRDGLFQFNTTDLRKIISTLIADGLKIKSKYVSGKDGQGNNVSYKHYWIEKEFKENLF